MTEYALVTGGSRGIGRAVCIRLARQGFNVIINYVSNDEAAALTLSQVEEAGGKGELLKFDVSDCQACASSLGAWQESHPDAFISVLVDSEMEDWYRVISTDLNSFYNVTRPLLQPMVLHKKGRIINIASLSGLKGLPGQTNYSAAKGGLIAATKALAQEVAPRKVTVNAIAPGFIDTDMVEGLDEDSLKSQIPARRFGKPEEVASLAAFLSTDEAAYITGQVISVNGGLY